MVDGQDRIQPNRSKLALITHLPLQRSGGGVYAVSWQIARQLERHFSVQVPAPLTTPVDRAARLLSRIRRRVLRLPGSFFAFSPRVLRQVADLVSASMPADSQAAFFRSSTRWAGWRPDRPYFVHTDACFHTFFHNTFQPCEFLRSDLQRIWQAEAGFLDRAEAVFFESAWGLEKARQAYALAGRNFMVARVAGGIEPPPADLRTPDGRFRLITMAKHFQQKGGDLVGGAFKLLKPAWPQLSWHILGGPPPVDISSLPDVHYEGFLRPDLPDELQKMRTLLSTADLLVHPTREDTNPLVLAEAASFGCPCVSMRNFAIPELVADGETGLLIDPPGDALAVADAIRCCLENPQRTALMRVNSRSRSLRYFSWDAVGDHMADVIHQRLQ